MNEKNITELVDVISSLTNIVNEMKNPVNRHTPREVEFDEINNPFGVRTVEKVVEKIVEVPVEVIKEVVKEIIVEVEVIKEVEKIVEIEVQVEVPVEVEKIIEVPVEVIKEVIVYKDREEMPERYEVRPKQEYLTPVSEVQKLKRSKETLINSSATRSEEDKDNEKPPASKISTDNHDFPDELFHSSGFKMTKFAGPLTYQPTFDLTPNQEFFGLEGEWNVVVTYDKDKKQYVTQHPEPQFNAQVMYEKKVKVETK